MLVDIVLLLAVGAALGLAVGAVVIAGIYWHRERKERDQ